jgi:actin-like protein 6A
MTDEIYNDYLRLDPKDHPVIFSEPSLHNKENRIKLTEFMFEKYGLPGIFICKSAVLSTFSCGRSTALVFDSGHSSTYAVPVHDGYALQKSLIKFDVAGNWVTKELLKHTENNLGLNVVPHYKFTKNKVEDQFVTEYLKDIKDDPSYEHFWKKEIIRDMKESCLSVSEDPLWGGSNHNTSNLIPNVNYGPIGYELPDGKYVDLKEERVSILEKLFHPMREFHGFHGYHQMIIDSISKCDLDVRKEMYSNIFVCGGNTLFGGFPERLQKQLYNSSAQSLKIKIIVHSSIPERKFSSWIGGSILSSLGTFHQLWLSKIEYEEHGAMIIERKCA